MNLRAPALHYNYFFHPNLCHVCKTDQQNILNCCPHCRMISYCSEEHRLLHFEEHKEICLAIQKVNKVRNLLGSQDLTIEQWVNFKLMNIQYIKTTVRRRLKPYEKQMFLLPKSCIICRRQYDLAFTCYSCKSTTKCINHIFELTHKYAPECSLLQHTLRLDLFLSMTDERRDEISDLLRLKPSAFDMRTFIKKSFRFQDDTNIWTSKSYIYTENFSRPLTLLFGLRIGKLLPLMPVHGSLVVHIIAGHFIDKNSLSAWEIVLHEFRRIKSLIIVMIGLDLSENVRGISVCQTCDCNRKSMHYKYISKTYHDYAVSSTYTKPNVIIGYHAEFYNDRISMLNLRAIQRERCPLFLTHKTKKQLQRNIYTIQIVLGLPLTPIINTVNRFSSQRPYRDYETDSVFYSHQFLIGYQDLHSFNSNQISGIVVSS